MLSPGATHHWPPAPRYLPATSDATYTLLQTRLHPGSFTQIITTVHDVRLIPE